MVSLPDPPPNLPCFVADAAHALGIPIDLLNCSIAVLRAGNRSGPTAGRDVVLETLMLQLFEVGATSSLVEHLERLLMRLILSADLAAHGLTPQRLAEAGVLPSLEPTPQRAVAHNFLFHCVTTARIQLVDRLRSGRRFIPYLHRVADNAVIAWHEQVDEIGARIAKGCRELVLDPRFRGRHDFEFRGADGQALIQVDGEKALVRFGDIMRSSVGLLGAEKRRAESTELHTMLEAELGVLDSDALALLVRGPLGAAKVMARVLSRVLGACPGARISLRELQSLVRLPYAEYVRASTVAISSSGSASAFEFDSKWLVEIAGAPDGRLRVEAFDRLRKRVHEEVEQHLRYRSRRERVVAMVDWFVDRWCTGFEQSGSCTLADLCSALARVRPPKEELMEWAKCKGVRGRSSVLAVDRACVLRAIHSVLLGEEPND